MTSTSVNVAVLGSTGSIGRNTLEVIAAGGGRWRIVGLTAHSSLDLLAEQARRFEPGWIVASDPNLADRQPWSLPRGTELLTGLDSIERAVSRPDVDVVVCAIVGSGAARHLGRGRVGQADRPGQ